jgi:ribosomal subunit interface protein
MMPSVSSPTCSMHIEHFEKGVRYTDKELLQVARKIGKMATYCGRLKDESSVIRVEAEHRPTKKQADEVHVMITVALPQKTFRSESRKAQVLEAFDRAVEKLEPQLLEYKERRLQKGKARTAARRGISHPPVA